MLEYLKHVVSKLVEFEDYIIWSFIFGLLHTLFSPKNRTLITYFVAFATSVPIGVLAGMLAKEQGYGDGLTYVITSIAALTAQDLVKFILGLSNFMQGKSETLAQRLLDYTTYLISKDPRDPGDNHK